MSDSNIELTIKSPLQVDNLLDAMWLYIEFNDGFIRSLSNHAGIEKKLKSVAKNDNSNEISIYQDSIDRAETIVFDMMKQAKKTNFDLSVFINKFNDDCMKLSQKIIGWADGNTNITPLVITLQENDILISALDLYSRIGIGQFRIEENKILAALFLEEPSHEKYHAFENAMLAVRKIIMPSLSMQSEHSFSIGNVGNVDNSARISYDILQVLRHERFLQRNQDGENKPSFYSVGMNAPMVFSGLPLPVATIKVEKQLDCAPTDIRIFIT